MIRLERTNQLANLDVYIGLERGHVGMARLRGGKAHEENKIRRDTRV